MDTTTSEISTAAPVRQRRSLATALMQGFLVLAVPVLLTLLSVRIVMSPAFLSFEYNRDWLPLPEDVYGFTREDRLEYAPYAVNYLLNDAGIAYLGDLTFPDGTPLYNDRELGHMEDVKVVTRAAFNVLTVGLVLFLGVGMYLWRVDRVALRRGLFTGSFLTLTLIGVIVVSAVLAWDVFFTAFHQVFFESGTWRFAYSDTLIRLFPERFWFDAAIIIGLLTSGGALLILWFTRWSAQQQGE
ncbi:MAG: TIGR01906 family membrane protein [Anaerolineae bacterium]